jgi:NAD(P)H-nitrite reductase large subunit
VPVSQVAFGAADLIDVLALQGLQQLRVARGCLGVGAQLLQGFLQYGRLTAAPGLAELLQVLLVGAVEWAKPEQRTGQDDADKRRQQRRSARLQRVGDDTTLEAFLLAGDTSAEFWIKTLLQDQLPAARYGRLLLMPGAAAPVAVVAKSPQVCTCFNVGEDAIRDTLPRCGGTQDQRLSALQGQLKCGTNCGSCIPELRRLVKAVPASLVTLA